MGEVKSGSMIAVLTTLESESSWFIHGRRENPPLQGVQACPIVHMVTWILGASRIADAAVRQFFQELLFCECEKPGSLRIGLTRPPGLWSSMMGRSRNVGRNERRP